MRGRLSPAPRPRAAAPAAGLAAAVVALAALALLPGCGFAPRGAAPPLALPAAIEVRGAPAALRTALRVRIEGGGSRLAGAGRGGRQADAALRILKTEFASRRLLVEPQRGRVRGYELVYSVRYAWRRGDGPQSEPDEVRVLREFVVSPGQAAEQATLRREMIQQAADAILLRLRSAGPG